MAVWTHWGLLHLRSWVSRSDTGDAIIIVRRMDELHLSIPCTHKNWSIVLLININYTHTYSEAFMASKREPVIIYFCLEQVILREHYSHSVQRKLVTLYWTPWCLPFSPPWPPVCSLPLSPEYLWLIYSYLQAFPEFIWQSPLKSMALFDIPMFRVKLHLPYSIIFYSLSVLEILNKQYTLWMASTYFTRTLLHG